MCRLAPGGPALLGYGALAVCALLIASSFVVPRQLPELGAAVATEAGTRLAGIVVLVIGVILVRKRIGDAVPSAKPHLVTSDDWDSSKWDPDVLNDIERRRRSGDETVK
jgi:hypothetical protein